MPQIWIEDVLGANGGTLPTTTGQSKPAIAADSVVSTSNTAATITYAAVAGNYHVIGGVFWSYNAAPVAGRLTITDAGVTVLDIDITVSGPGYFPFARTLRGLNVTTAMAVTLAAGGNTTIGKINVRHWTEAP